MEARFPLESPHVHRLAADRRSTILSSTRPYWSEKRPAGVSRRPPTAFDPGQHGPRHSGRARVPHRRPEPPPTTRSAPAQRLDSPPASTALRAPSTPALTVEKHRHSAPRRPPALTVWLATSNGHHAPDRRRASATEQCCETTTAPRQRRRLAGRLSFPEATADLRHADAQRRHAWTRGPAIRERTETVLTGRFATLCTARASAGARATGCNGMTGDATRRHPDVRPGRGRSTSPAPTRCSPPRRGIAGRGSRHQARRRSRCATVSREGAARWRAPPAGLVVQVDHSFAERAPAFDVLLRFPGGVVDDAGSALHGHGSRGIGARSAGLRESSLRCAPAPSCSPPQAWSATHR